jgi:hypothetical protein
MKVRRLGQAGLLLAGGSLAALAATRRWHQHWGATDQEITRLLPGDDLIPAATLDSTHAITIYAPADRIWPWLAQMGYEDRAGTYSYDMFERSIGRNLDRVDPDIAPLAAGGTMPFYPGAPMTVAVADPPHALVLWQVTSAGQAINPAGPWGDDYVAWTWAFMLEPVAAARTRLLVRMRVSYRPAVKWAALMWLLVEPAHLSWAAASFSGSVSAPRQLGFLTGSRAWIHLQWQALEPPPGWRRAAGRSPGSCRRCAPSVLHSEVSLEGAKQRA